MRVPITPQTNVPTGELGYEKATDVTAGIRALATVVDKYAQQAANEAKKRELFDVEKKVVDETNNLQTDFEERTKTQPLGAAGFTQQVNGIYNTRHQQMVQQLKDQGYSEDAVNEFATRLGTIRSQYVARAIDFQEKSNFAKTVVDADQMSISLSQYAEKNPNALPSALQSLHTGLSFSGLTQPEQEQVYNSKKEAIIKGAQQGFAVQHPDIVVGLYGFPDETKTVTNESTGELVNLGEAQQTISSTLSGGGFSKNVVAGFLGNFHIEGGYTGKSGDGGISGGIGQWNAERAANFKAMFGRSPAGAPIEDQAKFVLWEMQNPLKAGMTVAQRDQILKADSPQKAAELIDRFYERSDGTARQKRIDAATRFVGAHADATTSSLADGQTSLGNIDVSTRPPVQNSDGTVSTVRTISIGTDKGEVLIPTVVNGKVVSNEDAIAHYKSTGENLGTFKNAKAADAYAEKLHESEARRVANDVPGVTFDAQGKTGIPVIDMASGPERMQMLTTARTIMNEREADAKAADRQAHEDKLNSIYNQIEDGKLGQSDINALYQDGTLGDYDERNKAQSIYDAKHKQDDALVAFNTMYRSGQKFNPYDNNTQKVVDAGFAYTVKYVSEHPDEKNATPFTIAMQIYNKTGIIPTQGAVMLRGGLVSTDAGAVAQAAAVANNMIRANPNAFAGVEGQTDIEHAAVQYGHYIYDLGKSPQEAAQMVAAENDPQAKAKFKYNDPQKAEILKNMRTNGVDARTVFKNAHFGSQDQLNEANQTYYELINRELDRGATSQEATAQAQAQMQKVYGTNFEGVVVKYPPERAYPAVNGSWNYVYKDAQQTVKAETGHDATHLKLTPIPGVTDDDFRNGRPARYRIIYSYNSNGHEIVDSVPGEFAADVSVAHREASAENQKNFVARRGKAIKQQAETDAELERIRQANLRNLNHPR